MRLALLALMTIAAPLPAQEVLRGVKKIIFLGDSITHSGGYVSFFETKLRLKEPNREIEILNLGLPSETVSGLSEDGHAGGAFPRPDLHERLARVLDKTRPDLIFACYGMNDGIYLPFNEERHKKYREGLTSLKSAAEKAGAKVIFLTPPVFDTVPIEKRLASAEKADANHPFEGYGIVLDRYSDFLLAQKDWKVIDLHFPMKRALEKQREENPKFTFAGDGVHPNMQGQLVLGVALCAGLGIDASLDDLKTQKTSQLFNLVSARSNVLRDAWLTETKHKRPLKDGLPLDAAKQKAAEITTQIDSLLKR